MRKILATFSAFIVLATAVAIAASAAPPEVNEEGAEARIGTRARVAAATQGDSRPWTPQTKAPAAPGWSDEMRLARANDWEPAVAADPNDPYVYILTTRYGANKNCDSCRHNGLALVRSVDNGATWEPWSWIFEGTTKGWQADPQIAVDGTGVVHAAILVSPYFVKYMRSTDHGVTWSTPVNIIGSLNWADHPWLAVSADGMDVYVGFNHHQNYQAVSNDGGLTWTEDPIMTSPLVDDDYYFAVGATVLPNETVVFADADYGCCRYSQVAHKRPIGVWAIRSTDHGATWTETLVDTMAAPPPCTTYKCPSAYWGAQPSIASDSTGFLMEVYNGGRTKYGPEQIWMVTSSDMGATWSAPTAISPPAPGAGYPQIVGDGTGHFIVTYDDIRNGPQRNNVWVTETFNGGATWTTEARLSNLGGGPPYKHSSGFEFFYGDYGDMDIMSDGDAIAVWSEANNYWGPGNTWWAMQNT